MHKNGHNEMVKPPPRADKTRGKNKNELKKVCVRLVPKKKIQMLRKIKIKSFKKYTWSLINKTTA